MRVAQHLLRSGSHKHFFESRHPSPAKNDQINVICFGSMHDLFDRVPHSDVGFQRNFQIFRSSRDFVELFFKVLPRIIEHRV
jgi:hypothetical protein